MSGNQEPLDYNSPQPQRVSIPAIISLAMGIVAIPADCVNFAGVAFGLIAIVSGIIAVVRINKSARYSGRGLAICGILLGLLSLLLATICGILIGGGATFH